MRSEGKTQCKVEAAVRASLMGGKQPQCGKMIGIKVFGVALDSLVLQSLLRAGLFGLFLSFFSFFVSQSTGTGDSLGLFLSCGQTKKLLAAESVRWLLNIQNTSP